MKPVRNPWPLGLILAFALFIAGTAALIAIAASQRSDLVTPDYYEQELRYQTRLDALNRTAPYAGRICVELDAAGQQLQITLPRETLGPDTAGRIELYRPSAAPLDRAWPLQPDADGAQTFDVSGLEPGLWKVRLHWRTAGQDYFLERNLVLKRAASPPPPPVAGAAR
ncbi:MAG: FixH family protein [Verrucomicrobiae bacterium]|nr:FixH family protein [Verrucomicrobiae bacterium]